MTMRALHRKGIRDIAAGLASLNLPLAGRIRHFGSNWEVIAQDEWVRQTITGYRIEFLRKPRQNHKPTFTEKEGECMQREMQSLLDKQAISESGKQPPGLALPDVSGSKKGWQAKTCSKPKTVKPISED